MQLGIRRTGHGRSGRPEGDIRSALEAAGFGVDYVERRGGRVLGAVRLGNVRLIDNVKA